MLNSFLIRICTRQDDSSWLGTSDLVVRLGFVSGVGGGAGSWVGGGGERLDTMIA